MAIQSNLFRRLEDHAPFAVIGWSIWLALLQNIFFSLLYCQNHKEKHNIFLWQYKAHRKFPYLYVFIKFEWGLVDDSMYLYLFYYYGAA